MTRVVGVWTLLTAAVVIASGAVSTGSVSDESAPRAVSRGQILEAMGRSRGYNLTATSNGARLQAEVLLRLIHKAEKVDHEQRPLLVGHDEWYEAFLERTHLTPEKVPLYVRLPHEVGQDILVDYRRDRVIDEVIQGPRPTTVANVEISWPDLAGKPAQYSYDDLLSDPRLRVTQKRLIRYRLVDYGDRLWYADVSGLYGRPTSGPLGLLFRLVGEARVVESRSAFSRDGLQIVRGWGRKLLLSRIGIVTVWPDGHAKMGVPPGRPDLLALARLLSEPLEIRFQPFDP
jgi:hypothetical protein